MKWMCVFIFLLPILSFGQSDTLNQTDDQGEKQGYWIIYGKDRPEKGYPVEGRIEEGSYRDNRKQGKWIRYFNDGTTVKLILHYSNNRPNGIYEKRFKGGGVQETGNFTGRKYIGPHLTFYESGVIQSFEMFDNSGNKIDSSYYNYPNGCREYMIIYSAPGNISKSIRYKSDSCNVAVKVEIKEPKLDPVVYPIEPINPEIVNNGGSTTITYKLIIMNDQYYIEELCRSSLSGEEKISKRKFPVKSKGKEARCTDYNKLYNSNDEVFVDGEFKSGHFMNGKVYIYDEEGILLRIKVYKNGKYHSDGQL